MTLTDEQDSKTAVEGSQATSNIGEVLQGSVWQAIEQGRLICGVHDCAQLLQIDPFNAMLCVLPDLADNATDVSTHIHHMLIEAFCHEYDIRLVKVDNLIKLAKLVNGYNAKEGVAVPLKRSVSELDVNCLLLQYSENDPSEEDEAIAEYYKSCLFDGMPPASTIALPD